jgi:putative ABC transport system permease protein
VETHVTKIAGPVALAWTSAAHMLEGRLDSARSRFRLASRNVMRQGSRTVLLGLLIAFASLVIVFFSQFLAGVSHNFTRNLVSLATGDVYVASRVERTVDRNIFDRDYEYFSLPPAFYRDLARLPGYASAHHRLELDAQVVTEDDTVPYRLMAFDPSSEPVLTGNFAFLEGRMFRPGEYGVVVPAEFARRHGVAVGDRVRLLTKTVSRQVNVLDYAVTGIFRTRNLPAWLDNYAYLDLSAARTLVDDEGALTKLNVHLAPGASAHTFRASLDDLVEAHAAAGDPPLESTHWADGAAFFAQIRQAMDMSYLFVILLISVMIGSSLALTAMMTIVERTKEIATLGALGATPARIRRLLVSEALVLAAASAALGTAIAGVAFLITSQTGIPVRGEELRGFLGTAHFYPAFEPAGFVGGLVAPVAVAIAASYVLARRATRLPIAQAMADR